MLRLFQCVKYLLAGFLMYPTYLHAMQGAWDIGMSSSTQSQGLGGATHFQLISDDGLGFDIGYNTLEEIEYEVSDSTYNHSMSQMETSLLWQVGDRALRTQFKIGSVLSLTRVLHDDDEVISRFQPGYQVNLELNAPIYKSIRGFGEVGYKGWLSADMPDNVSWRYGLKMLFGKSRSEKERAQQLLAKAADEERERELRENPPVTINANVPEYVPNGVSESLPPIVAYSELCKCFPRGPYTLELGEFSNMQQAIRSLEFRGLRQFFNSVAYQRHPQPVFLLQQHENSSVKMYVGEVEAVESLAYWSHELKKNGINARFKKVIDSAESSDGVARVIDENNPNEVVYSKQDIERLNSLNADGSSAELSVNQLELENPGMGSAAYSADDVRRMNSLPGDMPEVSETETGVEQMDQTLTASEQGDVSLSSDVSIVLPNMAMEQDDNNLVASSISYSEAKLQVGPIGLPELETLLETDAFKMVLARDSQKSVPNSIRMVWDEGKEEAWLHFDQFETDQAADQWRTWLETEGVESMAVDKLFTPMGDIYEFSLAEPLQALSVEIDRQESISMMLERLRSSEVLWFQAYQKINDYPVKTSLNWSTVDQRYHLIVVDVHSKSEQTQIWSDLTAVGLLPSIAEP